MEGYNIDDVEIVPGQDAFGHENLKAKLSGDKLGELDYILYCGKAFILNLNIEKPFRHLGVGSKLIKTFDRVCIENNVSVAEGLFAPYDKKIGRDFYTKNGFVIIKEIYEQPGLRPIQYEVDIISKTYSQVIDCEIKEEEDEQ